MSGWFNNIAHMSLSQSYWLEEVKGKRSGWVNNIAHMGLNQSYWLEEVKGKRS